MDGTHPLHGVNGITAAFLRFAEKVAPSCRDRASQQPPRIGTGAPTPAEARQDSGFRAEVTSSLNPACAMGASRRCAPGLWEKRRYVLGARWPGRLRDGTCKACSGRDRSRGRRSQAPQGWCCRHPPGEASHAPRDRFGMSRIVDIDLQAVHLIEMGLCRSFFSAAPVTDSSTFARRKLDKSEPNSRGSRGGRSSAAGTSPWRAAAGRHAAVAQD